MRKLAIISLLAAAIILTAGCGGPPAKTVSLHKTDPNIATRDKIVDRNPLRVAVSSIISPKETMTVYQPVLTYLEDKLGVPVVLMQRRTYKEVNDLLQNGGADMAFVCSGGYMAGSQSFGMELLVVPEVNGERRYQSYIISRSVGDKSILDLRGRTFAYTDPMSFSGRIAPVYMLVSQGQDANRFFSRTFFTYSHDNAIRAVADGIADAAAVDSMIYDSAVAKEPELKKRTRVIDRSLKVGNPPVVVNATVDPSRKRQLQDLLLAMHQDEKGRKALQTLGYDKFTAPAGDDYSQLVTVWLTVKDKL